MADERPRELDQPPDRTVVLRRLADYYHITEDLVLQLDLLSALPQGLPADVTDAAGHHR